MPRQSVALQPHRRLFTDRKRNPDGKRGAVLHTAVRMFLERSYGRTSMDDVAMQLNITKPALYHYFRNKEEILVEIYRLGTDLIDEMLDSIEADEKPGLDKVADFIAGYIQIITGDFGRAVIRLDDGELSKAGPQAGSRAQTRDRSSASRHDRRRHPGRVHRAMRRKDRVFHSGGIHPRDGGLVRALGPIETECRSPASMCGY